MIETVFWVRSFQWIVWSSSQNLKIIDCIQLNDFDTVALEVKIFTELQFKVYYFLQKDSTSWMDYV